MRELLVMLCACLLVLGLGACKGEEADDDDSGAADDDDVADDDVADDDSGSADDDTEWGAEALEMVTEMAGTYQGDFEMFGLDAADASYSASAWVDTAVASNPRIEGDRAQVDVHDTMEMDGGGTYEMDWVEGLLIEEDGSTGEWFMEMEGVVTIMTEVEPGHFEYEQAVEDYDFYYWANITPENLIVGSHLTTKLVADEGGLETHDITRTTHLEYDDGAGGSVTVDYTSMEGTHQKQD